MVGVKRRRKIGKTANPKIKKEAPSGDELATLKNLMYSQDTSLFEMKVKQLVSSVKISSVHSGVEAFIAHIERSFMGIPPQTLHYSCPKSRLTHIPFDASDRQLSLSFVPPSGLSLIGGFSTRTALRPDVDIDLSVEMPKESFLGDDHLNWAYFIKKSLYLACLADSLSCAASYSFRHGNRLSPLLIITSDEPILRRVRFIVHPFPAAGSFDSAQLAPGCGNIDQIPSPYYNSSLLADVCLPAVSSRQVGVIRGNVGDAVIVLKVWARRRGMGHLGFLLTEMVGRLVERGAVTHAMSVVQIVKVFFDSAADSTGPLDVLVPNSDHRRLRHEAGIGLEILGGDDPFDLLLCTPVPVGEKFDLQLMVKGCLSPAVVAKLGLAHKFRDTGKCAFLALAERVEWVLRRALGDRVALMCCWGESVEPWRVGSPVPPCGENLSVGLVLDGSHCYRTTDRAREESFREFWGERCLLRRFPDGVVCESVIWPAKTLREKRGVIRDIVEYSLNRHCGAGGSGIAVAELSEDDLLSRGHRRFLASADEAHAAVCRTFSELSTLLQSLDGLPLRVDAVQPLSATLRFAEAFPLLSPSQNNSANTLRGHLIPRQGSSMLPPLVCPIAILALLESSSKWPSDDEAVRRLKASFYLRMAQQLRSHSLRAEGYCDRVDILYRDTPFRLEVTLGEDPLLPRLNMFLINNHQSCPRSYCTAVRIVKRWVAAQLLLGHIPEIVLELLVSHICFHSLPFTAPMSPRVIFLRFLRFVSTFDWDSRPLMIDVTAAQREEVLEMFRAGRSGLPPLFISTPVDPHSACTREGPSRLILKRLVRLSKAALDIITSSRPSISKDLFRSNFDKFDILIKLRPKIVSSLHAARGDPPSPLMSKIVSSFHAARGDPPSPLMPVLGYNPPRRYFECLSKRFSEQALFFYDVHGGTVIGVLLKPSFKENVPFSIARTNYRKPVIGGDGISVELSPDLAAFVADARIMGGNLIDDVVFNKVD